MKKKNIIIIIVLVLAIALAAAIFIRHAKQTHIQSPANVYRTGNFITQITPDSFIGSFWYPVSVEDRISKSRAIGVSWAKPILNWRDAEPTKGNYDSKFLASFDKMLLTDTQNGFENVIVIAGEEVPAWQDCLNAKHYLCPNCRTDPEYGGACTQSEFSSALDNFSQFAEFAVKRYSAAPYNVKTFQIAIEPNTGEQLKLDFVSPSVFGDLMANTYPKLKAICPDCVVYPGGEAVSSDQLATSYLYDLFKKAAGLAPSDPIPPAALKCIQGIDKTNIDESKLSACINNALGKKIDISFVLSQYKNFDKLKSTPGIGKEDTWLYKVNSYTKQKYGKVFGDIVALHSFVYFAPEAEEPALFDTFKQIGDDFNINVDGKTYVMADEFGYFTSCLGGGKGFESQPTNMADAQKQQANYWARGVLLALSKPYVTKIIWPIIADTDAPSTKCDAVPWLWYQSGAYLNDYKTIKPAGVFMKELIKNLAGYTFSKTITNANDIYVLEFANGNKKLLSAWTTTGTKTIDLSSNIQAGKTTIHYLDGTQKTSPSNAILLTETPVVIEGP